MDKQVPSLTSVSVEEIVADNDKRTKPFSVPGTVPQRFLPSRESSRPTTEKITSLAEPGADSVTAITPLDAYPNSDQNKSDKHTSKMSLVAQLACTDSHGKPLGPIPSSVKGRYQPLASDDGSLQPVPIGRTAAMAAAVKAATKPDSESESDSEGVDQSTKEKESADTGLLQRLKQQMGNSAENKLPASGTAKITPEQALAKLFGKKAKVKEETAESTRPQQDPTGGRARSDSDGFASSVAVISKLMKWTTKSKAVTETLEKYPGHLRDVRDRGRQERTELPLPLLILVKQEALPIMHSLAKAYKVSLGKHHKLTKEAFARYEELKSELNDADVFL